MNIGIDAKWFFKGNPSGRVVIQNLLREILSIDRVNQYYVFLRKEDKGKEFPFLQENVHLIYIWSSNSLLSNFFVTPYYAFKYKIDVFLYQYFAPLIKFSKVITLIHDVIFESHPEYFSLKERMYFKPMRFLAQKADMIVTVSHNEKERLVRYGYSTKAKVNVIHSGVSEVYFNRQDHTAEYLAGVCEKYKLPTNFVLYVGRLNYRKNIHNLIKAFQYISNPQVKLVLAGGYDWKMFDVKKFVADNGLEDRVQILGFVDDKDLPGLYALSTLFCFVSFDEGFGLPPLEAMASGTPVIVADRGSIPEICGNAALYVNPEDPAMIGSAIDDLFTDQERIEDLKKQVLAQAALFRWNKTASAYLKLFDTVVTNKK